MEISEEGYLKHHGVKGMRWGVRKEEKLAGGENASSDHISPDLKSKIDSTKLKLTSEQKQRIGESHKKHDAKFEKSVDDDPKGWRPTGKQVAVVAVGALAVGAIIYKVKTGKSLPSGSPISLEAYRSAARSAETPGWISGFAKKEMSVADFRGISETSIDRVWSGNYITKESFKIAPHTFQPGHQFFRVSNAVEDSFKGSTFAVASKEDAARYFLGWKESSTNLISFKAKKEVKIPDLHTVLETTREVLVKSGEKKPTPGSVINHLNLFAGSDFSSPRGKAILDALTGKGYHGIIDYMDQGVYGEKPLVLFDPSRLGPKVTTLRKHVDVADLKKVLTDIPNRR